MKTTVLSLAVLIALITICSCKKSNNSTTPAATSSQWSSNNVTYKGDTTFFIDDGSGYVLASEINDTAGTYANIFFSTKPAKSGSFTVVKSFGAQSASQCIVSFGTDLNQYFSAGGGTVNITIANGKITGTFSNIVCSNGTVSKTVSATLIAGYN
jgi:hypothetical protein